MLQQLNKYGVQAENRWKCHNGKDTDPQTATTVNEKRA